MPLSWRTCAHRRHDMASVVLASSFKRGGMAAYGPCLGEPNWCPLFCNSNDGLSSVKIPVRLWQEGRLCAQLVAQAEARFATERLSSDASSLYICITPFHPQMGICLAFWAGQACARCSAPPQCPEQPAPLPVYDIWSLMHSCESNRGLFSA